MIDELRGERIDLIPWSPEPEKYIASALAPAKVLSVHLHKDNKTAEVLVSNDMYSLAIGRNGQNVRLASQLTGWNIDVKSEQKKREEAARNLENAQKELSAIEGVGPKIMEVLIKAGWTTATKIASASVDQLTALQGIGDKTAEKLIESAKSFLEKKTEQPEADSSEMEPVPETSGEEQSVEGGEVSKP